MSQNLNSTVAVIGVDIGKNSFHVVGLDDRGAIVLRQNVLSPRMVRVIGLLPGRATMCLEHRMTSFRTRDAVRTSTAAKNDGSSGMF